MKTGNFGCFSQMCTSRMKTSTSRKSLKNLGFWREVGFKRNQLFPYSSRISRKRALLDLIKNKKVFHWNQVKIILFSSLQYIVCIAVVSFFFFFNWIYCPHNKRELIKRPWTLRSLRWNLIAEMHLKHQTRSSTCLSSRIERQRAFLWFCAEIWQTNDNISLHSLASVDQHALQPWRMLLSD